MLLSMLLDEEGDGSVTALYEVGPYVITIRQRPAEGRVLDKELEDQQEQVMASKSLEEAQRSGGYVSAFPNVGLVVWQAGFVLAEWIIRTAPLGKAAWRGMRILELGCGVGQCGVPLACTGAAVTLTDLPHIVGLTAENVGLNKSAAPVPPRVMPFIWGETDPAVLGYGSDSSSSGSLSAAAKQQEQHKGGTAGEEQQQQQPAAAAAAVTDPHSGPLDMVVAADVLYEPQYYAQLLDALTAACRMGGGRSVNVGGGGAAAGPSGIVTGGNSSSGNGGSGSQPEGGHLRALPLCYLCYRRRRYREEGFEDMALARGFSLVVEVPSDQLHPDYREGYRLIELVHDGVLTPTAAAAAVGASAGHEGQGSGSGGVGGGGDRGAEA